MAIVGYILLGILATLLLLLCVPVCVRLQYTTGAKPKGKLRWLLVRIDLLKAAEKKQAPARKPLKAEKSKEKKPLEFAHLLETAVDLLSSLKGGGRLLVRSFFVSLVRLRLVVAGDDAAKTAVDYGKCNAVVYSAYALAKNFIRMNPPKIDILPDFLAEEGSVEFELRARLIPLVALAGAVRIFAAFLVKTIQRKRLQQE